MRYYIQNADKTHKECEALQEALDWCLNTGNPWDYVIFDTADNRRWPRYAVMRPDVLKPTAWPILNW